MTYEQLRGRIERRIQELEGCTHQLCSLSDECAEASEARSLRQLLCEHDKGWQVWVTNHWETVTERPAVRPSTGCGCASCGVDWYGVELS